MKAVVEGGGVLRSDVRRGLFSRAAPAGVTVTETPRLAGLLAPVSTLLGEQQLWGSLLGSELCWRDRGDLAVIPVKAPPFPALETERQHHLP